MFRKPWHAVVAALCVSFVTVYGLGYFLRLVETGLYGMYALLFLRFGVSFALGGAIAGRPFIVPAVISVALVVFGIIVHTAYLAANVNLPAVPVVMNNLPILASAVVGVFLGAIIGSRVRGTRHRDLSAAR